MFRDISNSKLGDLNLIFRNFIVVYEILGKLFNMFMFFFFLCIVCISNLFLL